MSCGVGLRHGSDLMLLWLWGRPAVIVPIQPLAWELPYAVGMALKRQKELIIIIIIKESALFRYNSHTIQFIHFKCKFNYF